MSAKLDLDVDVCDNSSMMNNGFLFAIFFSKGVCHALEDKVGEQRYGCGIYYLQSVEPFGVLTVSAVR